MDGGFDEVGRDAVDFGVDGPVLGVGGSLFGVEGLAAGFVAGLVAGLLAAGLVAAGFAVESPVEDFLLPGRDAIEDEGLGGLLARVLVDFDFTADLASDFCVADDGASVDDDEAVVGAFGLEGSVP